ncbi:MAG: metallophosphoesterase [Tannerella sp.]|jgi:hypothetical protein|nr:metallophosphoesterase [Tannerella sp.]
MKTENLSQITSNRKPTDRRRFLEVLTLSGAGLLTAPHLIAGEENSQEPASSGLPLVDSPPVLQRPTETGITVVWAVGQPAAGRVEFGTAKDALIRTAYGDVFGQNSHHDRFLRIEIEGLKSNTRYFYRTVTRPFKFINAYNFEQGEPVYGDVFSFETAGAKKTAATFSVINDTHNHQDTLEMLTRRLSQLGSDYTVMNGDLVNSFDNADQAVEAALRPGGAAFATGRPMLFVPGNHDYRGAWARNTGLLFPEWRQDHPDDRALGRNFVVRTGPLAMIGLDTGEDKPDIHPAWGGLARFEPYRAAQRDWLERVLNSQEVATAPFVVAFCHIPIFTDNPDDNGGDSLEGYALFQRQAGNLWGPLLSKHGVQSVIVAHMHRFKYDAPTPGRTWAQICGGGPGPNGDITVIHGRAEGNSLEIVVDDLHSAKELGRWTFSARKLSRRRK